MYRAGDLAEIRDAMSPEERARVAGAVMEPLQKANLRIESEIAKVKEKDHKTPQDTKKLEELEAKRRFITGKMHRISEASENARRQEEAAAKLAKAKALAEKPEREATARKEQLEIFTKEATLIQKDIDETLGRYGIKPPNIMSMAGMTTEARDEISW
jgi:hypothetical protein